MPNTTITIEVNLNDAQIEQLSDLASLPIDQKARAVLGLSQGALEDLAAGGLMLSPAAITRLRGSLENPYDEDAIVSSVETAHRKSGDSHVISYVIDPSYVTPLTDVAVSNGMGLVDLVQQCIGSAFEMGWFYEMNLNQRSVPFSQEQYEAIRTKIGKEVVFGSDIADFIGTVITGPVAVAQLAKDFDVPDRVIEKSIDKDGPSFDRILADVGKVDPALAALSDPTRANAEDGERPAPEQRIEEDSPLFAVV